MTPLEITLIILLATLVAFMTGKIPFSVIASGIILALIMTGVMNTGRGFQWIYKYKCCYVCSYVCDRSRPYKDKA